MCDIVRYHYCDKKINKNATTTATARHRVKGVYKKNLKVEVSLSPETSPRSISCQRCMCSQSMGVNNCCQGLQTTVCNKTTHFQWRGFSCYRGSHKGFREQNLLSLQPRGNKRKLIQTFIPDISSFCPILDLRSLNSHLRNYKFRMLTQNVLF